MSSIYNNAISAYKQASNYSAKLAKNPEAQAALQEPRLNKQGLVIPSGAENTPLKPAFDQLVAESLNKSMKTEYGGEATSIKTLVKKAELHEMVTAVTNAELTLKSVVAVRDKVIGAYQEILRMQI